MVAQALTHNPITRGLAKTKGRRRMPTTLDKLVGTTGFEPATSRSRTVRATKLRYVPFAENILAEYPALCS